MAFSECKGEVSELGGGMNTSSHVKLDPSKTPVVSDFGKYLFDYIWKECERASCE